jgi:hypothetical protein
LRCRYKASDAGGKDDTSPPLGIIAGAKSNGYGKAKGIARDAKLVSFDISDDSDISNPICCKLPCDWTKLRVQSFSWGASYNQYRYHIYDQLMDSFIYSNPDFVIVMAAGNNGTQNGIVLIFLVTRHCVLF